MSFLIGPDFARPDASVVEAFTRVGTAALGHLTDFGFLHGLRPVAPCGPFAGPALTVRIPHVDATAVHRAMSLIRPGDVLVIDQSGDHRRSSFGGTLAGIAADLGAVAAVVDGASNDVAEIHESGFPVHSRGVTSLTTRVLGLEGRINTPVSVAGVAVLPGDLVFGDGDGVAVVPAAEAAAVAERLLRFEDETARLDLRGSVRAGRALAALTGADPGPRS
ncbi:RraA family protein [Streptomyces sp. NPDC049906]|uniref:RraA family protein n=1 Tax=Streptomyces sp. NPDC049906 TaxID=3155656 RepID=UPI0034460E7B